MREFMSSAAQPLPFKTPTDLLGVHDKLCWWYICYLAGCSNILSPDTLDSEVVSSSLQRVILGEMSLQWVSLWCSLEQRSNIFWCLGKYFLWGLLLFLVCCRDTAISSPQRKALGATWVWEQETPCVSHKCVQVELHFSSCNFCCWEAVPEF